MKVFIKLARILKGEKKTRCIYIASFWEKKRWEVGDADFKNML